MEISSDRAVVSVSSAGYYPEKIGDRSHHGRFARVDEAALGAQPAQCAMPGFPRSPVAVVP